MTNNSPPQILTTVNQVGIILAHCLCISTLITTIAYVNDDGLGFTQDDGTLITGVSLTNSNIIFNAHPLCMILSFLLMTLAGNAFKLSYLSKLSRNAIKGLHGLGWIGAIVSAGIGLYAVLMSHNTSPNYKANLYSVHSWIGLAAFGLFGIQFIAGSLGFGLKLGSDQFRATLMPYHKFLGNVIYYFWAFAVLTGFQNKDSFSNCGYQVTEVDNWPIENYHLIPHVCKVSHAVAMQVLALILCNALGHYEFERVKEKVDEKKADDVEGGTKVNLM
jgi:hypothetical protein